MGSARSTLKPIFSIILFRYVALGILGPVLPLYVKSLGVSVADWAVLASIFGAGMLLSEPLWGFLSDRVGTKIFLTTSSFLLSIILPLYSFKALVPLFFLLELSRGVFTVMGAPTTRAYVCQNASPERLGTAMGLWYTFSGIGYMIGAVLGGLIASSWTYESAFYVCSLISLASSIATLLGLKNDSTRQIENTRNSDGCETPGTATPFQGVGKLIGQRNVVLVFLQAFVSVMGLNLVQSFIPLYVNAKFNASSLEVGAMLAVFKGCTALTMPLFGKISERVGGKTVITIGFSVYAASVLCYGFATNIHTVFLVTAAAALGLSIKGGASLALLAGNVTAANYGFAMGVYGAFEDVGVIVAPMTYGTLWSIFTPISTIYAATIFVSGGAILGLALKESNFSLGNTSRNHELARAV